MIHLEKAGIYLSKPITYILVLIYLSQSALLMYLIHDKYELEDQIKFQQSQIAELEEKLKILKVIDDLAIGFTDVEKGKLVNVILDECDRYGYDPLFLMGLILTESSFKRGQTSDKGARGLMQVMPLVGQDLAEETGIQWSGAETLFDPEANVRIGSLHLFRQILQFESVDKGLVAYNHGETALRRQLRENRPLPKAYLKKVLAKYQELKERYGEVS
ncbi:MAG TPA: transglycosylase SLT domain-containing protein [candidate division Zixibacteria bacterium]|nr:transglycosylase SLT domain-containing protein [candidate division Zixibacteria bacterium]